MVETCRTHVSRALWDFGHAIHAMAAADLCRCRKLCHCQTGVQSESCSRNSHQSHLYLRHSIWCTGDGWFYRQFWGLPGYQSFDPIHIFCINMSYLKTCWKSKSLWFSSFSSAWHLEVDDLSQSASFGCRGRFGPCHRWFLLLGFVDFLQGFGCIRMVFHYSQATIHHHKLVESAATAIELP